MLQSTWQHLKHISEARRELKQKMITICQLLVHAPYSRLDSTNSAPSSSEEMDLARENGYLNFKFVHFSYDVFVVTHETRET
jgi:hypothetical protein